MFNNKNYTYFVAYHFSTKDGIKHGFGNQVFKCNFKLNENENIRRIESNLNENFTKDLKKDTIVVLLNWKLL